MTSLTVTMQNIKEEPVDTAPTRSQSPPLTASTVAIGDDAGIAGPSSAITPPRKLRRVEALRPVHITPPQMRMSEVSVNPPPQLMTTPLSMSPRSPHLHDEPVQPDLSDVPGNEQEATFELNLRAIPQMSQTTQHQYTPCLLRTPPIQGTPTLATFSSPTTPQPAATPEQLFWQNWQAQQTHIMQALDTKNRHLTSLSAHLPRISKNCSRHTTELTRLNNNLELMRAENSRILEAIQQQNADLLRQEQNFAQVLTFSQDILNASMQAQSSAMRDLNVIMTHIRQHLTQQQGQSSSSTPNIITPAQTPATSPQRCATRQSEARGKTPAKPRGRPAK